MHSCFSLFIQFVRSTSEMQAFLIAILALSAVVIAHHHDGHGDYVVKTREDLIRIRDSCSTKLNVPAELVEKYKKWEYPDDEKTRCYMKCVFEEFGLFDEQHGLNVKDVHHQLVGGEHSAVDHNDETHAKIERCADKNTEGSDACTWAYRVVMCVLKDNLQLVKDSIKGH